MFGSVGENWTAGELRISIDRPYVCAYWAEQLGVSLDVFRHAIATAGPLMSNIKKHLKDDASSGMGQVWTRGDLDRRKRPRLPI